MLHGSIVSRHGSAALLALIGLLVAVLPPTAASAQPRPAPGSGQLVRLVQSADGALRVERGQSFASADGIVLAEEADVVFRTALVDLEEVIGADGLVDDAHRVDQWALDAVAAEEVWTRADGQDQVIAIIDSGIDGRHPDLRNRLVDGWSASGGDPKVDQHGHGTHVAGTAGAQVGGGFGIAGIAAGARLMPVQVTDPRGVAYASDVAEGLLWAVEHGATVANLSLAGTQSSAVLDGAISHAVRQGVVVVAAAGNAHQTGNPRIWPAAHPDVVAVGSARDLQTRSSFSSTGDYVDILAPGSSILSDRPGNAFGYASGTSMAAPLVAGAIAVLRSADPDADPASILAALYATARDLGRRGRDDEHGHGFIDILAALDRIAPAPEAPVQAPAATPAPAGADFADDQARGQTPAGTVLDDGAWVAQSFG